MQITVKTTGLLGKYLPAGSDRNKGTVELPANSSIKDLLIQLAIPDDGRCYVSLNDSMLQASELDSTIINLQDKIILMAPIKAG